MSDKPWKAEERKKCRALGGERSGPTGRDTPDCDASVHVALEVKHYRKYVFLTKDWEQAVENAAKVGKPPVLNVRERGRGGRDCVQLQVGFYYVLKLAARFANDRPPSFGPSPIWLCPLVRISWSEFERLYHFTYKKEN